MKRIYLFVIILLCLFIKVNAEVTDTKPPELKDFSFSTTEITRDKYFNICIDASDDISGINIVSFVFKKSGSPYDIVKRVIINVGVTPGYPS